VNLDVAVPNCLVDPIHVGLGEDWYAHDNFRGNPISLVVIVAIAVPLTRLVYLVIGLMLGGDIGSVLQVFMSLFSSALWSVAIVPLLMPVVTRVHGSIFEEQSRG
jgi:hypothetical protein